MKLHFARSTTPSKISSRLARAILLSCAVTGVACGSADGDPKETSADAGPGPSHGGNAPADGGLADSGPSTTDAADGAVDPTPTFVSNTPGAVVRDVGAPSTPDIVLLSSNFVDKPSGNEFFRQWFGEIKNIGSQTLCQVYVDVSFKDASGSEIATLSTYVSADPYASDLPLSIPCIAPGKIGSFYTNDFASTAAGIASIKTIAVAFKPHVYDDVVPAAHVPTVTSQPVPVYTTMYGIGGTIQGASAPIYNIGVEFFPRDAAGLVLERFSAVDLDTLMPGATYPFTTTGIEAPFASYRYYVEFIDGVKPQNRIVPGGDSAKDGASGIEVMRRRQRDEVRARTALAATRR